MPIMKRCNKCHQLYSGKKCVPCDQKYFKAHNADRYEAIQVYSKARWKKCRDNILIKYNGYDIWMLAIDVLIVPEKIYIHHIVERDEDRTLVYDIDNLISVSYESHIEIHEAYKTDKPAALARIKQGIAKYYEMFPNN